MKKILTLILTMAFCFGSCSCGISDAKQDSTANKQDNTTTTHALTQEYAGEWKANVRALSTSDSTIYKVSLLVLNADGTATYNEKGAIWEYKKGTIHLAVIGGGIGVFGIEKEDGKTVLKYNEHTYYRASEFEEIDNVPALIKGKTELIVGNTYTTSNGMVFTLKKAELINDGTNCRFALYIASDNDFDIGSCRYNASNNNAAFSMQNISRDGNVTYFLSAFSFEKAKVESDAKGFGILSFTIGETDYYVSVDTFLQ